MKTNRTLKNEHRIDAGGPVVEPWVSSEFPDSKEETNQADFYSPNTPMRWSPQVCLQKEEAIDTHSAPTMWQALSMYFIHSSKSVECVLVSKTWE